MKRISLISLLILCAAQIASARETAAQSIQKTKAEIAVQVASARAGLGDQAAALADQITSAVLQRRAS